jgi:hypothetical protein
MVALYAFLALVLVVPSLAQSEPEPTLVLDGTPEISPELESRLSQYLIEDKLLADEAAE